MSHRTVRRRSATGTGASRWFAAVWLSTALVAIGPAAGASRGPDLAAFSGCVAAHSAVQAYDRGTEPVPATITLIASTIRGSKVDGARKIARAFRRARRAPKTQSAKTESAIRAAADWCTDIGVPPITLASTATTTPPAP